MVGGDFMAFIGFILLLSIIGTITGITGLVLASSLTILGKIAILSLEVFICAGLIAAYISRNEEKESEVKEND